MKTDGTSDIYRLAEELFQARSVGAYDVDRFGNVVFSSNETGQWELYVMKYAGAPSVRMIMTGGSESKLAPRFLRNETGVMFFSDHDGDEKFDIYVMETDGGRFDIPAENITSGTDYTILPNATASSDGSVLAYVSDEEGVFSSCIRYLADKKSTRLTNHSYSDLLASVSPDGKYVAVQYMSEGQDSHIKIYTLPQMRELFTVGMKDYAMEIDASDPSWMPESRELVFASSHSGFSNIASVELSSQSVRWLTDVQEECYEPVVSHDGGTVAFTVARNGSIMLCAVPTAQEGKRKGGALPQSGVPGCATMPRFSHDDSTIIFLMESHSSPTDLWRCSRDLKHAVRLTDHRPSALNGIVTIGGTQVKCRNQVDELEIPALLYVPDDSAPKRGGIVYIHGGPAAMASDYWDPAVQLLLQEGISVIAPNYRGSTGFGKKFRDSNRHVMGKMDTADCVAARNYLVVSGLAGQRQVGVTGGSFGGYLTMCCLAFYPELWKCGSAVVPFLNWFTEMESERGDLKYWDIQNMGDPVKDSERLKNASPYYFLENLMAPVQIIAGANDPRCPLEESRNAVEKLSSLGKKVDFKFYDGEGHVFRRIENRTDADLRSFSFLIEHLAGAAAGASR